MDSTKVKPNENKVFWEIVMCPRRFPNSCKCPALMEGGGSLKVLHKKQEFQGGAGCVFS